MVVEPNRKSIDEMKRVLLANTDAVTVKFPIVTKTKKILKEYGPTKQIAYIIGTQGEFVQSNAVTFNVEFDHGVQDALDNAGKGGCCGSC